MHETTTINMVEVRPFSRNKRYQRPLLILFLGVLSLVFLLYSLEDLSNYYRLEVTNVQKSGRTPEEELKPSDVWTYECVPSKGCIRKPLGKGNEHVPPAVCWLNCGNYGALWPKPTRMVYLGEDKVGLNLQGLSFRTTIKNGTSEAEELLNKMIDNCKSNLVLMATQQSVNGAKPQYGNRDEKLLAGVVVVHIIVEDGSTTRLDLSNNESYSIFSKKETGLTSTPSSQFHIEIKAWTVFGARHALETLLQLMAFHHKKNMFILLSDAKIVDEPAYPYRGLLVDTARNFLPVSDILKTIDAMAYNKMNVLHWHISDSDSFPFYSKSLPQMTAYGALDDEKIYYPEDISKIVSYAREKGVMIIPELDAPAHAANGWEWGPLAGMDNLSVCANEKNWNLYAGQPPTGQLNPFNKYVYSVLEKLFGDILEAFDPNMFHMGGDEVNKNCWNKASIQDPLSSDNFFDVWGDFHNQSLNYLKMQDTSRKLKKVIIWGSRLIENDEARRKYFSNNQYVIQVWNENYNTIMTLLNEHYQLIMSTVDDLYLDHGEGTWLGTNHIYSYKYWQRFYDGKWQKFLVNKTLEKYKSPAMRQVLGATATMWGEKVNQFSLHVKIWPRVFALAERLWSNPSERDRMVYSRINHHNRRMIRLGVHSGQLQPESCYLLSGHCDDPTSQI